MLKVFRYLVPLLLIPLPGMAQQTPQVEVFGGYSHLFANENGASFNLNGFEGSVTENINHWFGGVLDFSSYFGTEAGFKVNTQTLMYGPVFAYRRIPRLVPFGEAMVGGVRGSSDYLDVSKPIKHIAAAAGGGLDVNLTPRIDLRLIQGDYLFTRFSGMRQDNIRLSAGIVFRLGKVIK
jgi:Outer membrane protein beta-barrel domain